MFIIATINIIMVIMSMVGASNGGDVLNEDQNSMDVDEVGGDKPAGSSEVGWGVVVLVGMVVTRF